MNYSMPEHDNINLTKEYSTQEVELVNYWLEEICKDKIRQDCVLDSIITTQERRKENGSRPLEKDQLIKLVNVELKEARKQRIDPNLELGYEMAALPINPNKATNDIVTVYHGLRALDEERAQLFAKGVKLADFRRQKHGMNAVYDHLIQS